MTSDGILDFGLLQRAIRQFIQSRFRAAIGAFVLVGAWHGLMWNFLVWGAYHGCLLTGYCVYTSRIPAVLATSALYRSGFADVAAGLVTFFLVAVGWVPFMTDLPKALGFLPLMFHIA